jgi:probable HAF family extracellular repeat protein
MQWWAWLALTLLFVATVDAGETMAQAASEAHPLGAAGRRGSIPGHLKRVTAGQIVVVVDRTINRRVKQGAEISFALTARTALQGEHGQPLTTAAMENMIGRPVGVGYTIGSSQVVADWVRLQPGPRVALEREAERQPRPSAPTQPPAPKEKEPMAPLAEERQSRYTVTDLGPCGERPEPNGINEHGGIVGSCYMGQEKDRNKKPDRAFLWQHGRLVELPMSDAKAMAINTHGQVVGVADFRLTRVSEKASTTRSGLQAFRWQAERVEPLPGLDGDKSFSFANDVNDSGQIVGMAETSSGVTHAVLWEGGKVTDLGALLQLEEPSSAGGINERGEVMVNSGKAIFGSLWLPQHAYLWRQNVRVDLGTLGGTQTSARAINNRTEIVGHSQLADKSQRAFFWSHGQMTDLGTLSGYPSSEATDINDHGQIVGNCQTGQAERRAVLWEGGLLLDLNSLVPANSGWQLELATAINNRGWITGEGTYNGRKRAFLLTPVDLPGRSGATGYIPSLQARVTAFRFFESAYHAMPPEQRVYNQRFVRTTSRFIHWELRLEHPAPGRRLPFTIEQFWYLADGRLFSRQRLPRFLDADWISSEHHHSYGWNEPGRWHAGAYRVEVYIAGTKVASGSFEITEAVPAETSISRGVDYLNKGQLDEAIAEFSKAIELNPRAAAAYNNRGLAYANKKQYDQALADYAKAIELKPQFDAPHFNRGLMAYDNGQYEQALTDFTRAIEINSEYAVAYLNRGVIFYKTARFDQALADFRKALDINPKDAAAARNLEQASKAKSDITEPWQTSWEAFAKEVQRLYDSRAAESEFIQRFNGKRVFWEGDVVEVDMSKNPKVMALRMPEYRVTLPNGRVAFMEYVRLTVNREVTFQMFHKSRFRATLSEGDDDSPAAVSWLHIKNEAKGIDRTIIAVNLEDGQF